MNPWPVNGEVEEVHLPRPGHADLAGVQKYGFTDVRNVLERASARETTARVGVGALAKVYLRALGVEIRSHVTQIGSVAVPARDDLDGRRLRRRGRVAGALPGRRGSRGDGRGDQRRPQGQRVAGRHLRGDRLRRDRPGSARTCRWDERLDGRLAQAIMSIQAMKGVGHRRRLRPGRSRRLAGPRRDLLSEEQRLLPRDQPRRRARGRA